jgi:VWFA-related protein
MKRLLPLLAMSLLGQDVIFKSETRLVIVDLSIKDKSGRPITTLKQGDIEVLEDGVRQEVKVFQLQSLSSDPLAPVSFAANETKTIEEKAAPAPVAPAPVAKTTVAPAANSVIRYQDKRLLCLFFDMTTMQPPEQLRAQEAAIKFLEGQMTSSDLVEIMTYATGIKVVQEWTDNRDTLITALKKLTLGEGADLADLAATTADENDDSGSFVADETEFNIFNTDRKLSALQDAAMKLSVFPEKKALIYFSSGIPKTGVENESQIKATVNAAVRSNVAIYSVDARGLVATPPGGDASTASSRGTGMISGTKQQSLRSAFQDTQETLATISADTGGKVMLDTNDLTMGIRQAQEDISSYYIVGYYSQNAKEDGKYRRIDVRLLDKTLSAKMDFRKGYFASKVWQKFNAADKERQLEEALTLGDPVNDLPLALEVDYFRVARDRYSTVISVKIPGSAVQFVKRGGGKQTAEMDFIGQIRDASNKLVSGVGDNIKLSLNEDAAGKILQRHVQYDSVLVLAPGTYSLRFLARENQSGKMGTFETKFTVPDLNSSKSMRLSSVILSNQKEKLSSAVGAADANKKQQEKNPLVEDNQKIVPSITRVFRKDQTMYVYFEVYDPTMDAAKAPNLLAEFELYSGARKVYSSPELHVDKLGTSRPGVAPFSFQVALAKLPPGQYVSQVSVIDETGKKFAFPRNEVVLLPSAPPPENAPAAPPKQ